MEILSRLKDGTAITAHWREEDGMLLIAESSGDTRVEVAIDPLGAEALRDYLNAKADSATEYQN